MLSRPQIDRVKRLFLYPSHTSMKITASSDLPTGWHLLYPLSLKIILKTKNLLWKSLRLVQIIFREVCQGMMKWAIISLHQRVRFHQVHALLNALLPLKQGRVSSLAPGQLSLLPRHANSIVPLNNWMNQLSSRNWQKMVFLFFLFFIACEMNQVTEVWWSIQNMQSGTQTMLGLECIVMGKKRKKGSVYSNILTWVSCSLPWTIAVIAIS